MSETDQALVIRSQRGDRAAFEQLVRSTARLVFSRLYLETGDAHRAEDLSQETFLVAWRSIGQVIDPSGFRTWLLSVARTVHLDAVRREMRKKRFAPREPAERLALLEAPGPGPEESAAAAESRSQVLDVLRSLPEDYRRALTLRYIGGADYPTIERQLGVTNGSLRGLLSRGLAMLRTRLSGSTLERTS